MSYYSLLSIKKTKPGVFKVSVVKIYSPDNIIGRAIQSYIHSISESVYTSDNLTLLETVPALSVDIIFINLISSKLSPLKTIKHINTTFPRWGNIVIVIIVDGRDLIIYQNMVLHKSVVIIDLNSPLSYFFDIIKKHTLTCQNKEENRKLTSKERTVLCLLVDGLSIQEVSKKLQCDSKTIYTHRKNIIKKINFKNTMELNKSIARLRNSGG
ncbi:TPA: helix-turn-helix transcriptional regulator [Klebsiella pneumoniae]|nr:helix-turn-helix transcriptional regulator [Klebsiella pneumoniae]